MTALADSSAWIEYLRKTGSSSHRTLRQMLLDEDVATTDSVMLELLVGAQDDLDERRLARMLGTCEQLPQEPWEDVESAASLYRACRRAGETPRSLIDCIIAAVAIRNDVPVLHHDRDYSVLARHTPLRVVPG